jgi:predicted Zn-dependent peptidase
MWVWVTATSLVGRGIACATAKAYPRVIFTHVAMAGIFDIQRTEVAGIPVYWVDLPPPCTAALVFRVGSSDERLSIAGVTHLVEHLTLFSLGPGQHDIDGGVDNLRTIFSARGTPAELERFLQGVAAGLAALPLDRLELERQVLLTEAAYSGAGWEAQLQNLRFGAVGHGIAGYPEFGLHRLTAGEVARWAGEHFTRENAAVWITCDPSDLRLDLRPGSRNRGEVPPVIPGLNLPAYRNDGEGGVALQLVGPRSAPLAAATTVAGKRIHDRLRTELGISYDPECRYRPLGAHLASVMVMADCREQHAEQVRDNLLDILGEVSSRGPSGDELAAHVREFERALSYRETIERHLDVCAVDELLGAPVLNGEELLSELRGVTPAAVSCALEQALQTAIVIAPEGTSAPPAPFVPHEISADPLPGTSYRSRLASLPLARRQNADLRAGEAGVSIVDPDGNDVTIRWNDCEAVLLSADRRMTLIARDGSWMELDLSVMRDTSEFLSLLRRKLSPDLFLQVDDEAQGWLAVEEARDDLRHGWVAHEELKILGRQLHVGEHIARMAQGKIGVLKAGVLAATDRRLIFVRAGIVESHNQVLDFPRESITSLTARSGHRMVGGAELTIHTADGKTRFTEIVPRERAGEIARIVSSQSG